MSFAPRSLTRSRAAVAVLPVANTGATTMTSRSARSEGALKKYSIATNVSDRGKARYARHVQLERDRACLPRMSCRLEELAQKQVSFQRFAALTFVRVAFRFRHWSTAGRA